MKGKKQQSKGAQVKAPESPPPEPEQEAEQEKPKISLETFKRDAQICKINEPESIEALNRLGYTISDLNYKPKIKFVRPGCDDSVTTLLYNKAEEKRNRIIEEALQVRAKIVEEKKAPPVETAVIRKKKNIIVKEKKLLQQLESDQSQRIRKLIVAQLRDMYNNQIHVQAVERTISRMTVIEEQERQKMSALRARTIPTKNPQEFEKPPPLPPVVDVHYERYLERRKKEEQERKAAAEVYQQKMKAAFERSEVAHQTQKALGEEKLAKETEKFLRWQASHEEAMKARQERIKARNAREMATVENGAKLEEDRRNRFEQKIEMKDRRAQSALVITRGRTTSKLADLSKRTNERAQKAREELQRQEEDRERFRNTLDERDLNSRQRARSKLQELTLANTAKSIDREDRIERARRKIIAAEYQRRQRAVIEAGDPRTLSELAQREQQIATEKQRAQRDYLVQREQVANILMQMHDPEDPAALKRLAAVIRVDEEEMTRLVETAKASSALGSRPQSKRSRPGTALSGESSNA